MKRVIFLFFSLFVNILIFAQSPESINYQAIVRNNTNQPLQNTEIQVQFDIIQSDITGTVVYSETQTDTTNDFGLINLEIGNGSILSGNFSDIDWANGPFFLNVKIDYGNGLTDLGTQKLISVPYALPLALLAGFLEIVPNLGPTIAMIPAVFVSYITFGPVMAGIVFLLYIIIQQIENNVLVPRVMHTSANVNPLIAITVILTGFKLGGMIGALLSIPVYIIFRTFYSTFVRSLI